MKTCMVRPWPSMGPICATNHTQNINFSCTQGVSDPQHACHHHIHRNLSVITSLQPNFGGRTFCAELSVQWDCRGHLLTCCKHGQRRDVAHHPRKTWMAVLPVSEFSVDACQAKTTAMASKKCLSQDANVSGTPRAIQSDAAASRRPEDLLGAAIGAWT